jgi:hypothetical protein
MPASEEVDCSSIAIWPLWNAHRLLERAKSRLRWELGKRLERVTNALTAAVDAERYERVAQLKEALGALQAASQTVGRARTWPWAAETPRLFVSALLLPMLAWLLQQLLSRLVG